MAVDRVKLGDFLMEAVDAIEAAFDDEESESEDEWDISLEEMVFVSSVRISNKQDPEQAGTCVVYHSTDKRSWVVAGLMRAASNEIIGD